MKIFDKTNIIGLDIGSSSVKLAHFIKKGNALQLVDTRLKEFEGDKNALACLKEVLKGIDIKKSKFIVSINSPTTAVRKIKAPYIPKEELGRGVRLKAKNYFSFPLEEASLDFEIAGTIIEKNMKQYELWLAASSSETINKYLSLLDDAGVSPASLITAPIAIKNLMQNPNQVSGKNKAVLDIGKAVSEITIFRSAHLSFSRKIPVAGDDFTAALTEVLVSEAGKTGLSLEDAERIKRQIGIPEEGESKTIEGKISTTQIFAMLRPSLEHLVNEIGRSFRYFKEENPSDRIDSIILLGGGSSLKGLDWFLSRELGIQVAYGESPRFALAIGAGLDKGGINLLPLKIKERAGLAKRRLIVGAIITFAIFISAIIYIGMNAQLVKIQKEISIAGAELSKIRVQFKDELLQDMASGILQNEPPWEDIFKELSNIIPDDIYLTGLDMKGNDITMKGLVVSADKEIALSNFILSLEKGIFANVKLVTTKHARGGSASEFEIKCWIDRQ